MFLVSFLKSVTSSIVFTITDYYLLWISILSTECSKVQMSYIFAPLKLHLVTAERYLFTLSDKLSQGLHGKCTFKFFLLNYFLWKLLRKLTFSPFVILLTYKLENIRNDIFWHWHHLSIPTLILYVRQESWGLRFCSVLSVNKLHDSVKTCVKFH